MTANVCPGYRWEVAKVRNSKEETRTLVSTGPCSLLQVRVRAYPFSFVACGYWEHNDMALKHGFVLKTTLTACVIILMRYPEHLCTVSLWLKQAKDTRDSFPPPPLAGAQLPPLYSASPDWAQQGFLRFPSPSWAALYSWWVGKNHGAPRSLPTHTYPCHTLFLWPRVWVYQLASPLLQDIVSWAEPSPLVKNTSSVQYNTTIFGWWILMETEYSKDRIWTIFQLEKFPPFLWLSKPLPL